jgi:hypothetical protein
VLGQPADYIKWNPKLEDLSGIKGYIPSTLAASRQQRLEEPMAPT